MGIPSSLATAVVLSMVLHLSIEIKPEVQIEGSPYTLVIYDFHQETDVNGNCLHLSNRAVEALMSLKWSNELMNKNTQSNVGLLVYDSCGSLKRTFKILGQYINTNACGNVTEIAGVTTFTRREIQTAILDVIRPFGIVHTGIVLDDYVTSNVGLSLSIAGASMWKPLAVMKFMETFQWNHVNVFTVNNTLAETDRELFLNMASSYDMCAFSVPGTNINSALMNLSSSNVLLLFVSGHDDLDELLQSLTSHKDQTFLIVGDSNINFVTTPMENNTFFIREKIPIIENFYKYLENKFSVFNETDPIISKFLDSMNYCQYDSTFNHTVCSNDLLKYLKSRSHDRISINVLSAYYNIFRAISRAKTFSCTNYDFTKCNIVPNFASVSVKQNQQGYPIQINELINGKYVEEEVPVILSSGLFPMVEVAKITNDAITFVGDSRLQVPSSLCSDSCYNCGECFKKKIDRLPTVMAYDGDIVLTAGFPIYKDSVFGQKCSELSMEGIIMANSLKYAIDTVQDKYPTKGILPGVSIGALIYDTCGGKTMESSQILPNSNCPATFYNGKSNLTLPGKWVSNIEFVNSLQTIATGSMDLANFQVSSSGLSSPLVQYDVYLETVVPVLKSLNWTYISIVYSEELKNIATIASRISQLNKDGICIFNEIIIKKNNADIRAISSQVSNTTITTGAVLLFTTKEDTVNLINELHTAQYTFDNVNIVFFPWNYISNLPRGSIVVRPKQVSDPSLKHDTNTLAVLDNGYSRGPVTKDTNRLWVEYHENRHKCHVVIDDDTIFPNTCTNQPTFSSNDEIDMTVPNLIVDYVDTTVNIVDELYKSKCPLHSGICDEFKSYNKFGSYIESSIPGYTFQDESTEISFTTDGNLRIPLEIINKRADQQSSEVKVGEISGRNDLTLSTDQVFAYDSNDNAVILQHQCPGWCSSCRQCQTTTTQNIDHHYTSGDIDLLGMFPIHKKGVKVATCGSLSLDVGTEYLTESFLYAVNTAKSRYPYLLPGINLGSLIIDTCSGIDVSQQALSNFESCFASFSSSSAKMATPVSVPGYFLYTEKDIALDLKGSVQHLGKYAISHSTDNNDMDTILGKLQYSYARSEVKAIVNFLTKMGWTYISVVSSVGFEYESKTTFFMEYAKENNICVSTKHVISDSSSISQTIRTIERSPVNVVILFLSVEDIRNFFGAKILQKVHIICETNISWNDTTSNIQIPLGSIVVDRINKINNGLKLHLDTAKNTKTSIYGNPWIRQFITERRNCQTGQECTLPHDIMIQSSSVVIETDLMLHALHNRIEKICGQGQGMCKMLESVGLSLEDEDFRNINFTYEHEDISFNGSILQNGAFQINNFQVNTMKKVGEWKDDTLFLSKEHIQAYDNGGMVLNDIPLSRCFGSCVCINYNNTTEEPKLPEPYLDPEMPFFLSSAELNDKLWVFVILAIACGGVAASMLFVFYVIYKTCRGLLNKRYIGLGLLLLISVISVYLSVLPFIFTPSKSVCTSRYLVPGITYALTYATCLTKLMSLRSYKLIGLGGEISNLNQFLTVCFVTAVQIAIGVQHVALRGPFLETRELSNETMYACKFNRDDFLIYLIYVMLLVIICALYSFIVRKEKKNMGEAIFILISSWINVVVWIVWVVVMVTITRDYVELTICLGLIVCATVIILTIFVPKLHKIAKLKYDVKKSGVQNGGYKIDTEFMFERPHTLPGGFRHSYNFSPQKTNPKSISTFDSSFSY